NPPNIRRTSMSAVNLTVDLASMGTTFLFLIISFFFGAVLTFACTLLGFFAEFGVGLVEVLAGGRPSERAKAKPSKLPIVLRSLLYIAGGVGSLVLAANGMAALSYLLAIVSAFCFGVALVRLFSNN
ncbi:MAG: hypothetical protein K2Z81_27025, partial [Cyanobacteria bacterium]|nr:hypothetical protein [Cyanobacteriota bacterium]